MKFSLYIAQRYLKSKSGNNIINIVTILASLGVVAGTMALFIVLSVFTGIKNYSLNILDKNTPDIRITASKGKTFLTDSSFISKLPHQDFDFITTKILEERAFFKSNDKEEIAFVKGVDSLFKETTPIDSLMMVGEWFSAESSNACIVDYPLTRALDLNVYTDRLQIYVPKTGKGYITNPKNAFRTVKPQVIGVFSNQNQDDKSICYVPLKLAQKLLGKRVNEVSYVDLKINNSEELNSLINDLKTNLTEYNVTRREEINGSFYKILNSEKLIAYLVSLLVVIMVLSNTSGTIIMVIVDKKKDIKTLLNMGANIKSVRQIFTVYGFLLNITGMLIGLLLGIALIYLQLELGLIMINTSIPYPVAFEIKNVWIVCLTIIVFGALASLLASSRISKKFVSKI
ncbi:ABC transporter permease [Wenyingzhuangia sp. IMCC45533]